MSPSPSFVAVDTVEDNISLIVGAEFGVRFSVTYCRSAVHFHVETAILVIPSQGVGLTCP